MKHIYDIFKTLENLACWMLLFFFSLVLYFFFFFGIIISVKRLNSKLLVEYSDKKVLGTYLSDGLIGISI